MGGKLSTVPSLEAFDPTPALAEAITAIGGTPKRYHQVGSSIAFSRALRYAYDNLKYGKCVSLKTPEELRGMRLFMSEDGRSGFALDGDQIVAGYSLDKGGKSVHQMLQLGIDLGGRRLDCFDTVLPELYSEMGFKVVARAPFDPPAAPKGWDRDRFSMYNGGEPDVVQMAFDPARNVPNKPGVGKTKRDEIVKGTCEYKPRAADEMVAAATKEIERLYNEVCNPLDAHGTEGQSILDPKDIPVKAQEKAPELQGPPEKWLVPINERALRPYAGHLPITGEFLTSRMQDCRARVIECLRELGTEETPNYRQEVAQGVTQMGGA